LNITSGGQFFNGIFEMTSTNNVDSTKNNTLLSNKWNWVFIGLSFVVVVLVILMVYYFVKQNNSAIISNIPNKVIIT
jgi:VIT1/CCC1 family predicted Fe2+/Mn2+ transporter